MTIRIPSLAYFDKIISKGVYILPLGNHLYFVGSTYNHTDLTDQLTEQGQSFLREKISDILSVDYEVIDSLAGVRPTVKIVNHLSVCTLYILKSAFLTALVLGAAFKAPAFL